jgi:hypothetical protein
MDRKQEQEIIKEHQERLKELFQSKAWEDLKEEIRQCYENADVCIHTQGYKDREELIGECRGYRRILELERKFK